MGHLVGKDLYRQLGRKIDGLATRAPWNETLYAILKELYSEEDAELIVRMPFRPSSIDRIEQVTGIPRATLQRRFDRLCPRGLVMDIRVGDQYYYLVSPMIVGIFEFTMMRTDGRVDHKECARLFSQYLADPVFGALNFGADCGTGLMRTVPHDGAVRSEEYVEVLDYEKATAIIETAGRWAVSLCSCRHEKEHLGEKACDVPLENCSTLGSAVDFMVRNRLAREISKTEMLENVARSREMGLVLNADNVKQNVSFMCHCCSCCCTVLNGITTHGYPNAVVTSNYIAGWDRSLCKGCATCTRRCPIGAIPRVPDPDPRFRKHGRPQVDESLCIGCGVCAIKCPSGAMRLHERAQRVLYPETTFERVILRCLERGTLQNQLFDDPGSKSQYFMRGLVGGFLRLAPVKRALMSDALRSRFLDAMKGGAVRLGKRSLTEP